MARFVARRLTRHNAGVTAPLQLAIRFILELAAVVAAGVVGASVGSPPIGIAGGIGLAASFIVVWGLFLAPRARFPQSAIVRLVVGTLVMEAPAIGLVAVGSTTGGAILAVAILANAVALAASGATTDDAGGAVR
jgi:membrane protein YdbS with pleckstrin-like domain